MFADIIFVIGAYKNGGVARHSTVLANEFAKRGKKSVVLATGEVGNERFFELHENVKVVSIEKYINDNIATTEYKLFELNTKIKIKVLKIAQLFLFGKAKKYCAKKVSDIKKGTRLRFFFKKNKKAVIIPFGIEYCARTLAATSGMKRHIIFAEKNASQLEAGEGDALKRSGELLSRIDASVFQTTDECKVYEPYVQNSYLTVIHNPINPNLPKPYHGKRREVIVNFCRVSDQKNLPLLLDAFEIIHNKFPSYKLEIYGNVVFDSEQKLKTKLLDDIASRGLSDCASILPSRSDVHEAVKDCAMFVSSSDYEGLSNSMIEAMAIGMPCICTDCLGGGAREVIVDRENGLLVPMNDSALLAQAMEIFIEDAEFAESCGHNAEKVIDDMNSAEIGAKWLELITRVTNDN